MTRRAFEIDALDLDLVNPRDFAENTYRRVDDRPYGGGPGMVMMAEPLDRAIDAALAHAKDARVIYLSPQGGRLDQAGIRRLAHGPDIVFLCGRYEGIDERLIEARVDAEISIGDYVLAGGELAAMVIIEAMVRLLPDVLGNDQSAEQDSFTDNLLDCRHYTRPELWQGCPVPETLLSGDHEAIKRWRFEDALRRTAQRRPELLELLTATRSDDEMRDLLRRIAEECNDVET